MDKNWKITVWGVRGSAPAPYQEFMEYGGNTSCVSVRRKNHMVVFDAGTGLITLGREWDTQTDMRLDILISHLHIDHVMGLFLFQPLFAADMEIHLYGGTGLEQKMRQLLSPPWWPLGVQDFKAKLYFHEIQAGDRFELGGFAVSTMAGNHPGGNILYRLESDGKRLVHALDCESDEGTFERITDFAHGSDLIIWDANFTTEDFKESWGHSTWEQGLKAGHEAGAGRVLMTHYSHGYTDNFLREQEREACKDALCIFAKERMEIIL